MLLREKYINNFKSIEDTKQGILRVYLKYDQTERPVISGIKRVSKPGRRVYVRQATRFPRVHGRTRHVARLDLVGAHDRPRGARSGTRRRVRLPGLVGASDAVDE